MKTRTLGATGFDVSTLCLGTMSFGAVGGNPDIDECVGIVRTAVDHGINFIDTADVYGRGESEEIVGKAIRGLRDEIILVSKAGNPMSDDPRERGASRQWITRACEDSLRRLNTDYLDLYLIHRLDPSVEQDETLGALSDLVRAGKVRAIGTSTYPAERIVESQWVAKDGGHIAYGCEQPPYSIFVRGAERDVLPTSAKYDMGVMVWSPLNGGWLTGKYRGPEDMVPGSRLRRRDYGPYQARARGNELKFALVHELSAVAAEAGMSLIDMAIAFALNHPAVTSSIIGPRTFEQFESQVGSWQVELTDDVLDRIDAVVPPGTNVSDEDTAFVPASLDLAQRRR